MEKIILEPERGRALWSSIGTHDAVEFPAKPHNLLHISPSSSYPPLFFPSLLLYLLPSFPLLYSLSSPPPSSSRIPHLFSPPLLCSLPLSPSTYPSPLVLFLSLSSFILSSIPSSLASFLPFVYSSFPSLLLLPCSPPPPPSPDLPLRSPSCDVVSKHTDIFITTSQPTYCMFTCCCFVWPVWDQSSLEEAGLWSAIELLNVFFPQQPQRYDF